MAHFVISALSAVAYGGYTYFRNILRPLAEVDPANRYTVLVKPQHLADLAIERENVRFLPVPACAGFAAKRMAWEQAALPGMLARLGADAVYTANNVGLLCGRVPMVNAVRNLEPFFHREYEDGRTSRARNDLLFWLTRRSVARARRVVVVSEFTRDVVSRRCGGGDKLRVIYHGRPDVVPDEAAAAEFRSRHALAGEFFLTNSKFVPYSNLHMLVTGYSRALERNPDLPPLVLAGGDASPCYKAKVMDVIGVLGLREKVLLAGLIPHATNLALMREARLFLFATLLEACPNTLIEAMTMGCVVACSDRPPMREIAGDAVRYFDPADPEAVADGILGAYGLAEGDAAAYRAAAVARSRRFDWKATARGLVSVLEEAAGWTT